MSVYNPSEHAFLPGLHGIPKAQEEEEDPHTYMYIDETLVYSHLLKDDAEKKEHKKPLQMRVISSWIIHLWINQLYLRDQSENRENLVTKSNALIDNELYGYVQGQSSTSDTPKTSEEEGNYETRLCVWGEKVLMK